ncbi:hypothetical protein Cgig2_008917 [Carnegiea gigantea]|uniref:Uncharacterized protein n=1 Tax=Carnegiea gigantea TaxID=171969 RepID=A0A9Q1JNH9_9CARY|nr:hypothetical protein Cgig2_008917 [Carnegiea gigantea]
MVLAIHYERCKFELFNVDLDRYQIIDLYQDTYLEGNKSRLESPKYFWFVYSAAKCFKKEAALAYPNILNHFIIQQLQLCLTTPIDELIESPKPTIVLSAYLSSQLGSSSQPTMPSLDKIDVSLGGLEAYDLRNLNQQTTASNFDYKRTWGRQ